MELDQGLGRVFIIERDERRFANAASVPKADARSKNQLWTKGDIASAAVTPLAGVDAKSTPHAQRKISGQFYTD
ncbi:MAG TPA: hypothetical protein VMR17_10800 [Xanthobacteraceae bacterium]|jgi:hypothetical protein|nr:hypothetical protein [Xanthobacteraceae bacterium]